MKSKFVEAIQNYQEVERQFRQKYKQRMERQFRIVKPDATPDEVKAVVNDDSGSNQIFQQAVSPCWLHCEYSLTQCAFS